MQVFHFRFDAVLQVRRNRRVQCQAALAQVLRRERELSARRELISRARVTQIDELRKLGGPGEMDMEANAIVRSYAVRLSSDLDELDQARLLVAAQIDECRAALIAADQAVSAFEKLAARRRAEFLADEERRESLEREDIWRSASSG